MDHHQGRRPQDADYGLGKHTIDGDRLGLIDESDLTDRLLQTFAQPNYRPPRLPAVAMELLALSRQPDVKFPAIESLLERDAMLAGELLAVARSAHYSAGRLVCTLRSALVRLGLDKLRDVVLQAALNLRVFRSPAYGGCMERLRHHCRSTAHLGRIVARHTRQSEEKAFLCGLLHDVGIAGILLVLAEVPRDQEPPDLAVLWPAIDGAHARAGARMVELWKLPPEVAQVVGAHHQVRIDGTDHSLAAVVCLAEALAAELNLGFVPTREGRRETEGLDSSGMLVHGRIDVSDDAVVRRACEALDLTDTTLERLREDARAWAATESA